jgi:hypothetical protein
MADYWDGRYVLRPPRDHGSDEHYMVYADAKTADDLVALNAFNSAPRRVLKSKYDAELLPDSGRRVTLDGRTGTIGMHIYRLARVPA